MAEQLTPLEQVQADAARITLKRIADEKESKAWQEAQQGTVSLDDKPEPVAVVPKKPKAKKVTPKPVVIVAPVKEVTTAKKTFRDRLLSKKGK